MQVSAPALLLTGVSVRFAADAQEIIVSLAYSQPPIILGHSYGEIHWLCAVATAMISLFNPQLSGLVVLDQPPRLAAVTHYSADPKYADAVGSSIFDLSAQREQIQALAKFDSQRQQVEH